MTNDKLIIGGHEFTSRFILGSGKFSVKDTKTVLENGGVEMATLSVRRANTGDQENILDYIPEGITLLPNTSGARTADEAVRIARLAREMGCGDFVKIEIIRDSKYLLPDNEETIRATEILAKEGFIVMPYMMPDLAAARKLEAAGAASIMPLAAPIGSNKGLYKNNNRRNKSSCNCGRRHRQAFTGLRSYGTGMRRSYGQYSYRHCR